MKHCRTLLLILLFGSQLMAQESVDLENIALNFSPIKIVETYDSARDTIQREIEAIRLTIAQEKSKKKNKLHKIQIRKLISKKYTINNIDSYIWKKPLDDNKELTEDNEKEWLTEYEMTSFSNTDTTAYFRDVIFNNIDFFEAPDGMFVALHTQTDTEVSLQENITKIETTLTQKYGAKKSKIETPYSIALSYNEWQTEEIIYIVIYPSNNEGSIRMFIVNKEYINDLRDEFSEGVWLFLR